MKQSYFYNPWIRRHTSLASSWSSCSQVNIISSYCWGSWQHHHQHWGQGGVHQTLASRLPGRPLHWEHCLCCVPGSGSGQECFHCSVHLCTGGEICHSSSIDQVKLDFISEDHLCLCLLVHVHVSYVTLLTNEFKNLLNKNNILEKVNWNTILTRLEGACCAP